MGLSEKSERMIVKIMTYRLMREIKLLGIEPMSCPSPMDVLHIKTEARALTPAETVPPLLEGDLVRLGEGVPRFAHLMSGGIR